MVQIHSRLLLSPNKKWNCAIFWDVGGPRDCHIEWNKSGREKYHIISLICGISETVADELICKTEILGQVSTCQQELHRLGNTIFVIKIVRWLESVQLSALKNI